MQTAATKSRKRRDSREIATLIARLNRSDLTVAEFAARAGVSVATIYAWKRRVRKQAQTESPQEPIRIVAKSAPCQNLRCQNSGIRLHLPSGIECSLAADFDPRALARLLEVL